MLSRPPSACLPAEVPSGILLEHALEFCRRRHGMGVDVVIDRLERGDRQMHSSFRYGLARELSGYLSSLGQVCEAVYVYGSSIGESASPASDIDVIIVVKVKRDELANVLRRLDYVLSGHFRRLAGLADQPSSLFDIHVIARAEQAERVGHGAVIDGLHTRAICLWRSDPAMTGALNKRAPGGLAAVPI